MSPQKSESEHFVFPGMRICEEDSSKYIAGTGTYIMRGYVYANVTGLLKLTPNQDKRVTIEVMSPNKKQNIVPKQGDIVTAKVVSVNPRMAKLIILCVRDHALSEPYRAQLRKEDVRATEKDRVEMYKSFKPGDIILARLLSLGESQSGFLVTTAENELGVVIAKSESSGQRMVPISWTEMQCPETFVKENRKLAKVCPENLASFAFVDPETS